MLPIPKLKVVPHADKDGLAAQASQLGQVRRNSNPTLRVELHALRPSIEKTREVANLVLRGRGQREPFSQLSKNFLRVNRQCSVCARRYVDTLTLREANHLS